MQIDEIGSDKKNNLTAGTDYQAQVRKMAQNLAAEQLSSHQATASSAAAGSSTATANSEDVAELSKGAIKEVKNSSPGAMNRRTELKDAVLEKLNNEILNPNSEFNRKKSRKSGDGGKKRRKVKRTKEWKPEAQAGQIHEGREVIGKMRITEEVQEEGGGSKVGAAGKSASAKPNSKPGSASDAAGSKPGERNGAEDKKAEDNKEVQEAAGAQSGQGTPLKVEGLSKGSESKAEEPAGGSGGSRVREFDVRGQAFGVTQTQTIKGAKELHPGERSLGTFRKLDDKPMLKYVTLHSKDTEQAVGELKKNARAAGESPEAIQQAVEKLKEKPSA